MPTNKKVEFGPNRLDSRHPSADPYGGSDAWAEGDFHELDGERAGRCEAAGHDQFCRCDLNTAGSNYNDA